MEYDHMSFGGPPVTTETDEEAEEIMQNDQKESDIGNLCPPISTCISIYSMSVES